MGDTIWTKTYGGAHKDGGYFIRPINNCYIIIGETNSFGPTLSNAWLIKIDSLGDTIWTKGIGDFSWNSGNCVQNTTDGGYIIVGTTEIFGTGNNDLWLIKTYG